MVTWENYEEYMMLYADGELSPAEERALVTFVEGKPELMEELELCATAKLVPDTAIVYAAKEQLMKPVPAARAISLPMWQRYAIAAGVAAILFISVFKGGDMVQTTQPVAAVSTPAAVTPPQPAATKEGSNEETVAAEVKPVMTAKKEQAITLAAIRPAKRTKHNEETLPTIAKREVDVIEGMAMADVRELVSTPQPAVIAAVNAIPEVTATTPIADNNKRGLLESLPIEDIKKAGMAEMAGALASAYRRVNAIKHDITEEKNITVRIEKKQLILSF